MEWAITLPCPPGNAGHIAPRSRHQHLIQLDSVSGKVITDVKVQFVTPDRQRPVMQLGFDEHDNAQLAGIRQDRRQVPAGGMSTGTADQVYLALRVAAIEDYLDHAEPMPFIADDLFINFDDKRAAAGFRVLGELAKKTHVLFFTHHEHQLEVARTALGVPIGGATLPADAIAKGHGDPAVLGPRSSVWDEERKQVARELNAEPAVGDVISLHPAVLARHEQQSSIFRTLCRGV